MKVSIEYLGLSGTGGSLKEAKEDCVKQATAILKAEDWDPKLLTYRGQAIVVYHSMSGWQYRGITLKDYDAAGAVFRIKTVYGTSGEYGDHSIKSRDMVVDRALYHLAQSTWEAEDGDKTELCISDNDRRDFASWTEFQLRYRKAKALGLTADESYAYAARDPRRPELIELLTRRPKIDSGAGNCLVKLQSQI